MRKGEGLHLTKMDLLRGVRLDLLTFTSSLPQLAILSQPQKFSVALKFVGKQHAEVIKHHIHAHNKIGKLCGVAIRQMKLCIAAEDM